MTHDEHIKLARKILGASEKVNIPLDDPVYKWIYTVAPSAVYEELLRRIVLAFQYIERQATDPKG